MNVLRLAASMSGAKTSHSFSHHLVQKSEVGLFDKIKTAARTRIEVYKSQAREKQDLEQVLLMSDSMLKDIGLTHIDRDNLRSGQSSLADLNALREAYRRQSN